MIYKLTVKKYLPVTARSPQKYLISNCLRYPDQSVREELETVQGETEVMVGRLQAALESHSECLKKSQEVFEDHDDLIQGMLRDSVKRTEIFEDKNHQMKSAQQSLEKKTNDKFSELESKVVNSLSCRLLALNNVFRLVSWSTKT